MARFTLPRDLYHGKGALEALKTFEGKRAMICVGGGSMKRFGFLDKAAGYLREAGMEVELFEGIEPDPSVETVMRGAEAMIRFQPDWIIAMGGGSPIDAAKAMWIKYEYPETTFEDMRKVFGLPKLRKKARFCAISSTSGTATEVTAFSIITDYAKGIKYPVADFEITPDVAIVDPDLAETMPRKLVAHTGMDAMTHAVEAYVSTANCDFTDPLALHAIKMIQHDLVDPHYRLFNGAEIFLHKREIQRFFLKELGGVPRVEGNGTQRIFNLMGNGGQEGGLGIIKGAQSQILFLQKELLLVIFLQMKIENNATDSTYRDKCQKNICQPVYFRSKRSYNVRKMVCDQTQSYI